MQLLRLAFLAVVLVVGLNPASGQAQPAPVPARNLFSELLGKSEAELDAKIGAAWKQLFYGDDRSQRVYYPVGDDMAYIADVGSNDVRSEGMSYGMMLAVQLDKKSEFNRLWKWANRFMRHADGPRKGYFAWHCKFDGSQLSPGSASDGEEWFAMALFFAAHRWGSGEGIFNYGSEAQALLREMLHKTPTTEVTPSSTARKSSRLRAQSRSRPVHGSFLPSAGFLWAWARWATDEADRVFWREAAATSRKFFRQTAHPVTGLMPEYAHFDGSPFTARGFGGGKGDFRVDAWRTLSNVGLDQAWWRADPWHVEQSNRVLRFLQSQAPHIPNQFTLDGKPLSQDSSTGLIAMAAVAGLAADPGARPSVRAASVGCTGPGRPMGCYYDGLLYFLGLLQAGGRFQVHQPAP